MDWSANLMMDESSLAPGVGYTYVLCYTRIPLDNQIYSEKLAYSMHVAVSKDGKAFEELNHNSGILFAKATTNAYGTLNAKSLKNPCLFETAEGSFGVIAIRIGAAGEKDPESNGRILLFTSSDLLGYKEIGLIDLKKDAYVEDAVCHYHSESKQYEIHWRDESGHYYRNTLSNLADGDSASWPEEAEPFFLESVKTCIEGAIERNIIRVSPEVGNRLKTKLSVLRNTGIIVPDSVYASSPSDLDQVMATAVYSDGSTAFKRVSWECGNVDWKTAGVYEVKGRVRQDHYPFPMAVNRADPCIIKWKGRFYFIATNDDTSIDQGIYLREAATIPGLLNAQETLILDDRTHAHINHFFWAPEFHVVEDDLYIFFAGSDGTLEKSGVFGNIHSHVMKLRTGGDPAKAMDWEAPIRVRNKEGEYLFDSGITLDMTCFSLDGKYYVLWAQRQFSPVDQGSWLYIANVDPKEPWRLTNDPVLISRPEYGWANNNVIVDEGPFAILSKERVMVTFSAALVDATYSVGILTARRGDNLLDPDSWTKGNYPILTSRSVEGEYGPGHNSYVFDDDGNCYSAYHARYGIKGPRSSGIRRVHFAIDGDPVLDLTEDLDLNQDLAEVMTRVLVRDIP